MVEINNQRKAFLDMLAVGGASNGRQKTRNRWLWRHCRRAIYWLLICANLLHKPKLKSTGAGRYQLLSVVGMPTASGLAEGLLSGIRTLALQQIKERGALPMIDRGDVVRHWWPQQYLGFHCRALVMVSSSIRLTSLVEIQRNGRNGQRDWCMSRVTAIISALVICIIVCLSWAVNHYADNALPTKPARQNAKPNWRPRTANCWRCRCVSVMNTSRSLQNTRS